jgi:hypothetical protein
VAAAAPLRVGIVIPGFEVPAWIARALRLAFSDHGYRPALVVIAGARDGEPRTDSKARGGRTPLLLRLYDRFDAWRFPVTHDAMRPEHVEQWLPDVPVLACAALGACDPEAIPPEIDAGIRAADLDVIAWLLPGAPPGWLSALARRGAWHFAPGVSDGTASSRAGLAELLRGEPVVRAALLAQDDGTGANTDRFSARRTASALGWAAAPLLRAALRDSGPPSAAPARDGASMLAASASSSARSPDAGSQPPGLLRSMLGLGGRYVRHHAFHRRHSEQWGLAFRQSARDPLALSPGEFVPIRPPADRFWADPFPVTVGGQQFVLFEELPYARALGHIVVAEFRDGGFTGPPEVVLAPPFHLSYPFVFEWKGDRFLMPEMSLEGRIEVHRATRAPYEWALEHVMMEGQRIVDATIVHLGDRWWMFSTPFEDDRPPWSELQLHHAPTPLGPWTPHRANPVVRDVRSARMAGRIFCHDGEWYRPAQDCSASYGHALALQRIDRLDLDGYSETEVARLDPGGSPHVRGMHTFNREGDLTFIDARWRVAPRR